MIRLIARILKISNQLARQIFWFCLAFCCAWFLTILINDIPLITNIIKTSQVDDWLVQSNIILLDNLFTFLGYETNYFSTTFRVVGSEGIRLDFGCLAIRQIALFVGFSTIYPLLLRKKIWYIPLGIVILLFINFLRLFIIELIQAHQWTSFEFIHNISGITLFNLSILFLWYWQIVLESKQLNKTK